MKYALITPPAIRLVDCKDYEDAIKAVGLDRDQTDHGVVAPGISIVCWELCLRAGDKVRYFSIGRNLSAGNAILYAFDAGGYTVDLKQLPPIVFYRDMQEVERAIEAGDIDRPMIAMNGEVFWCWPNAVADDTGLHKAMMQAIERFGRVQVGDVTIIAKK